MRFILPKLHFFLERWKWNEDYQIYVSNMGRFKYPNKTDLFVKTGDSNYLYVETAQGLRSVHRMVMITWRPIENADSITVDHIDHNPRNNALYNLEWCTRKENLKRANRDKIEDMKKLKSAQHNSHYYCIELNKSFEDIGDIIVFLNKKIPYTKTLKEEEVMSRINYAVSHGTKAFTYRWKKMI